MNARTYLISSLQSHELHMTLLGMVEASKNKSINICPFLVFFSRCPFLVLLSLFLRLCLGLFLFCPSFCFLSMAFLPFLCPFLLYRCLSLFLVLFPFLFLLAFFPEFLSVQNMLRIDHKSLFLALSLSLSFFRSIYLATTNRYAHLSGCLASELSRSLHSYLFTHVHWRPVCQSVYPSRWHLSSILSFYLSI